MFKQYKICENKIAKCSTDEGCVFVYISPEKDVQKMLIDTYKIDEHTLNSALDPDEISRLEFEPEHTAVILKSPKNYSSGDNLLFKVTSVGLFLFKDKLIVVIPEDIDIFEGKQAFKINSLYDVFLKILYGTISHFLGHLKVINMISDSLEEKINESMENKFLINMFTIEKSLVFYLNGINSNEMLFEKLKLNVAKMGFTTENIELLDDIIIENQQCNKQAQIYSDIITGLMDARGSIVNNNLNLLIKRLTILSVVFMPLNVLTGMGGMSEFSVITKDLDWRITYSIFGVCMVIVAFVTYYLLQKFLEKRDIRRKR